MEDEFSIILKKEMELNEVFDYNFYNLYRNILEKKNIEIIKRYFKRYNINKIVIYGVNLLARYFVEFLADDDMADMNIEIVAIVDKYDKIPRHGFSELISVDKLNNIKFDLIIITAFKSYNEIIETLNQLGIDNSIFIQELTDDEEVSDFYENYISYI